MTPKQEQLKKEIGRIWEIETIAKECFEYSYYLHKPKTSDEAKFLNTHYAFKFIRHVIWRMTVIEISKLFSDSPKRDKFDLRHFIHKLREDQHYGDMGISSDKILEWEVALDNSKSHINNILTLRDKIYAHTDPKKEDYKSIDLTFEDIQKLIQLAENIIREIYLVIFDSDAIFRTPSFDRDRFDIIKILAQEKEKRLQELLGDRFIIKK